jgi:hypothetical protein
LVAACADDKKQESHQAAPTSEDKVLEKEFKALPKGVIIAVPLDAEGNELTDRAEMRTTHADNVDADIEQSFNTATAPKSVVGQGDELDEDSSTQSWLNWRSITNWLSGNPSNNWGAGQGFGGFTNIDPGFNQGIGGGGFGGGGPVGPVGGNFYQNYRPWAFSLTNTAQYWSYGRPNCIRGQNVVYYSYPRTCQGFNFCGPQPRPY